MTSATLNTANCGNRTGSPNTSRALTVLDSNGLHLRAAAEIVKVAHAFDADITLQYRDLTVNARSVLAIIQLSAGVGATVHATGTGPEAQQALVALASLFSKSFGEAPGSDSAVSSSGEIPLGGIGFATLQSSIE